MGKRGRKPRGDRQATTVSFPRDHLELYRATADRLGLPLGDYVSLKLAEAHGLPRPAYIPDPGDTAVPPPYVQETLMAS